MSISTPSLPSRPAAGSPLVTDGLPTRGRVLPAWGIVGFRWISKNPAVAIAPVLIPFIFLYFLRLISPASLFPGEIVGAMLFTTQNTGNWVLGDSAYFRIEMGLQDLFVASPLGKFRYLLGVAFSNLIAATPALVVLGILLSFQPGVHATALAWVVLAGVILLLWLLFASVGVAISSRIRTRREVWPVGNLTFTALGMISPLYYPLSVLPPLWQDAARFLPGTYAAEITKGLFGVVSPAPTVGALEFDALLLVVVTVAVLLISTSMYRWRED